MKLDAQGVNLYTLCFEKNGTYQGQTMLNSLTPARTDLLTGFVLKSL